MNIEFFSLCLNGQPFVKYQYETFSKLNIPWRWHVIEGAAAIAYCGAWGDCSKRFLPDWSHKNYLSVDGTTEYLDSINDDRVIVYRKKDQLFNGKIEMVNVFLPSITEESILWEVDIDELYTVDQIKGVYNLFNSKNSKDSALWWCYFFVGPKLFISGTNCWGNNLNEWQRIWKFRPGMKFSRHEPPILMENDHIVGQHSHYDQEFMEGKFGRWQHFAYTTEMQMRFKRDYYGAGEDYYQGWLKMQKQSFTFFPNYMHQAMGIPGDSPVVHHVNNNKGPVPLINIPLP